VAADLLVADRLTRIFSGAAAARTLRGGAIDRVAVRDLSLSVAAGEIVALLGPNGAGKTTTMRMLAGLILPTAGRVAIDRVPITPATADQARRSVGLLTEAPGLWERLTVRVNLLTYARLQGLPRPQEHVTRVLQEVDVADRADEAAGRLSKGLKQRVALARALIHRPPIVLLDEPTSGLDPASARQIRDLIARLKKDGCAVLVSTHNLVEAEELADRIAIVNTQLLALDTTAALRNEGGDIRVRIEFEDGASETRRVKQLSEVPDLVRNLVSAGRRIVRVVPDRRSLEDVYLSLVGADR
jgi:ABC-2 type transport system ATP-binding protein